MRGPELPWDAVLTCAFFVGCVLSPLALAGATPAAAAAITVGWGGLGIALVSRPGPDARVAPVGLVALMVALAWTAAQALPLPVALVRLFSPSSVERATEALRAVGAPTGPSFVATSFAPAETVRMLATASAVVIAFLFAARTRQRIGRRAVLTGLVVAPIAVALVTAVHVAADAQAVYGLHVPRFGPGALLGPIVNTNQLAGFLALGLPILLGLAIDTRSGTRRALFGGAFVMCMVIALAARSRGGAAAALLGPTLAALGAGLVRRRESRGARTTFGALAVVGVSVLAFAYVVGWELPRDYADRDLSKLDLAWRAATLALDQPLTGIGRGAFDAVFTQVAGSSTRYTHPENVVVQWAVDWGLVVSIVVAIGVVRALGLALRAARRASHVGAVAGLVALAMHDLVDFALEMPGIAVVAAACLGAVAVPESGPSRFSRRLPLATASALAALAGALSPLLVVDRAVAHVEDATDAATLDAASRVAARLHPSDARVFLAASASGVRLRRPWALRALNRTMTLAPGWPSPHLLAASVLLRLGRLDQARIEVREADALQPGIADTFACALASRRPRVEFVLAMGRDASRVALVERVRACPVIPEALREGLDAWLLERPEPTEGVRLRGIQRSLAAGDTAAAVTAARALVRDAPRSSAARQALASALARHGDVDGAVQALERAFTAMPEDRTVLVAMAHLQAEARRGADVRRTIERLRHLDAGVPENQAADLVLLGQLEKSMGNLGRAMQAFDGADRIHPEGAGLEHLAALAESMGEVARAQQAYSRLCARQGADAASCTRRDELRSRLLVP